MGIDFSHTTAQWSYTGFSAFRRALALFEGFELDDMNGFGGDEIFGLQTVAVTGEWL